VSESVEMIHMYYIRDW